MSQPAISIPGYVFPPGAHIGSGAFGSVWVGLYKGDLPRAVKVFKPGGIHEASWRTEYEKLRALDEPPGIVTLYDSGHTADGSPYVSMRLMADRAPGGGWSGRTLGRALADGTLSGGERWRLVEELADPLAYLHRKGVKHCDVKPSNILLTAGDEPRPVLCDFGQSRVELGEGTAFGTAFYASPEQLRSPDWPAEHWDVYSFGATAYQMVTGELPRLQGLCDRLHGGQLHTVGASALDQTLIDQRSAPPGAVAWQLPAPGELADMIEGERPLEAPAGLDARRRGRFEVILRCLEVGGGARARYADMGEVVDAFAAVERRFLVAAERRKNFIFATLMVFGLLAAGLAGWHMVQANMARDATGAALVVAEEERAYAQASQVEAGRQRDRARHAQQLSERLINQLLYDLRERLEPLGRLDVLDQVSRDAELYFAALPEGESGPATERERSTMLNFRGDVHLAEGDHAGALERYREGLGIREALLGAEPGSTSRQRDVSVSLERIAEVHLARGEHRRAKGLLEEVVSTRRAIRDDASASSSGEADRDLALALQKLGGVHLLLGQTEAAVTSLEGSIAEFRRRADQPLDRQLCATLITLGDAHRAAGRSGAALEHYRKATACNRRLLKGAPENVALQNDAAAALLRTADILLEAGADDEALAHLHRVRKLLTRLLATDLGNMGLRTHLALTEERVADAQGRTGDLAGAGGSLGRARELIDAVIAAGRGAEAEAARQHSARLHRKCGEHLSSTGHPAAAGEEFSRAIETLAGLRPEPEHRIAQVVCLYNLYAIAREDGDGRSALGYCRRSLDELQSLRSDGLLEPRHTEWIALLEADRDILSQDGTAPGR